MPRKKKTYPKIREISQARQYPLTDYWKRITKKKIKAREQRWNLGWTSAHWAVFIDGKECGFFRDKSYSHKCPGPNPGMGLPSRVVG